MVTLFCPWCGVETDEHDAAAGIAGAGVWDGRCTDCLSEDE